MSSTVVPFKVTSGPYEGEYEIDVDDLTASETLRIRQTLGVPLQTALAQPDAELMAVLVWIVRTRGSQAKGLAFQAVADNITRKQIAPLDDKPEGDALDPTSSDVG